MVDDERAIRHALSTTLGTLGFEVEEAETGEEALAMTRRSHYDAVLMDINMPGMGGVSACREIKYIAPALSDPDVDRAGRPGRQSWRHSTAAPTITLPSRSTCAS